MERWDLLDENGRPTGERMVRGEPIRPGRYHRVVHVWVMDSTGRLLIQKRAPFLRLMPGEWTVTSGSAVAGEDSRQAAARELGEAGHTCSSGRAGIFVYPAPPQLLQRSVAAAPGCGEKRPPLTGGGGGGRLLGHPGAAAEYAGKKGLSSLRPGVF